MKSHLREYTWQPHNANEYFQRFRLLLYLWGCYVMPQSLKLWKAELLVKERQYETETLFRPLQPNAFDMPIGLGSEY